VPDHDVETDAHTHISLVQTLVMGADDPAELVGTVAGGKYRVIAHVGRGSMGNVYEVEELTSGRRAAMKMLLPELGANEEIAARLVREGKAISMLTHPNIVELLDIGRLADGTPFVVTELIRGVVLTALLAEGPVERGRAIAIVRQVLEALDHAHRHGVIHRDIKPDNIMIVDDLVKVLDFGVAKLADDTSAVLGEGKLTRTGFSLFGSPLYVAPESVLGNPIDARTDLYSAGVILFELLAGCPPFDDPDPMVLLRLHAAGKTPTLAERAPTRTFTADLEYVVAEALAKQPARRFGSAADMIGMLDAAQRSLEAPAPIAPPAPVTAPHSPAAVFAPPPVSPAPAPAAFAPPPAAVAPLSLAFAPPPAAPRLGSGDRRARDIRRFLLIGGVIAAIALIGLIAALTSSDSKPSAAAKPATRPPVAAPSSLVAAGHAQVSRGGSLEAIAAYEQAIAADAQLAKDPKIRANAIAMVTGKDPVAAVVALELLAIGVDPPEHDAIVRQASTGAVREVRQRALAIAMRDGFADGIDRFASLSLDLRQARNCEDRRVAIERLRDLADRRAIAAIKGVKGQFPCVEQEAEEALTHLEALP